MQKSFSYPIENISVISRYIFIICRLFIVKLSFFIVVRIDLRLNFLDLFWKNIDYRHYKTTMTGQQYEKSDNRKTCTPGTGQHDMHRYDSSAVTGRGSKDRG